MSSDHELTWERMPSESDTEYAYWTAYRELPPNQRTAQACADKVNRARGTIYQVSSKHKWADRIKLYEQHLDRLANRRIAEARTEQYLSMFQTFDAFETKLRQALSKVDPESVGWGQIVRSLELLAEQRKEILGPAHTPEQTEGNTQVTFEVVTPKPRKFQ